MALRQGRNSKASKSFGSVKTESPTVLSTTSEAFGETEDENQKEDSFLAMLNLDNDNSRTDQNEETNLSDLLEEINKKLEMVEDAGNENEDSNVKEYDIDYYTDIENIEKKPLKALEKEDEIISDIGNELADEMIETLITEQKDRFPKEAADTSFDIEHNFNLEDDPVKEDPRSSNINKKKVIPLAESPVLQIRQQPLTPAANSVSQAAGQFLQQQQQNFPVRQQYSGNNNQFGNQQQYNPQFNKQPQFVGQGGQFINAPQQEFTNANQYNGNNFRQQQYAQPQPNQYLGQSNLYQQQPQVGYQQIQSQATPRQFVEGQDQRSGLLNNFGDAMGLDASIDPESNTFTPGAQLSPRQQADEAAEESGSGEEDIIKEEEEEEEEEEREEEEEVRCINKVMQVTETVYENRIKCQHTFTEKCHDTFITDYVPTQERKCETSFDKRCHITYKPMMFEETVQICNEPLKKVCSNDTVGEEVCKTHYETNCETRFKEHEVEQDEPVCEMVTERKCNDVRVPVPGSTGFLRRKRRQADVGALPTLIEDNGLGPVGDFPELNGNDLQSLGFQGDKDLLSVGEECEDWQVQKCTLEKKVVKKVNPETSCQKMPREICAPSNCAFKKSEKVCRDETKSLIQNIPTEECDLEPQENCKMETVLVPRLIQQPNCIKVPKEICVNAKSNPKKVKKPVIKEWCYKPSDLKSPSTRLALSQFFSN